MIYERSFSSARKRAEEEIRRDDSRFGNSMLLKCDREAKIHALILKKVVVSKVVLIVATLLMARVTYLLFANIYTPYEIRLGIALAGAGSLIITAYLLAETLLLLKQEKACANKLKVWQMRRNQQLQLLNENGVIGHR